MKPDDVRSIECSDSESIIEVSVGETLCYRFVRHESVGIDAEVHIDDTSIVRLEKTDSKYLYPERLKRGWTGADEETVCWYFKALKEGATRLIVRNLFRGEVEKECTIELIVKKY